MKLYRPKPQIFWLAFILGVLGFLGRLVTIPIVSEYNYWFLLAGFVLLVLGVLAKGF